MSSIAFERFELFPMCLLAPVTRHSNCWSFHSMPKVLFFFPWSMSSTSDYILNMIYVGSMYRFHWFVHRMSLFALLVTMVKIINHHRQTWRNMNQRYGGFLSHRGTPSNHPFLGGIFHYKPSSVFVVTPWRAGHPGACGGTHGHALGDGQGPSCPHDQGANRVPWIGDFLGAPSWLVGFIRMEIPI